jgi:hypothetical protein
MHGSLRIRGLTNECRVRRGYGSWLRDCYADRQGADTFPTCQNAGTGFWARRKGNRIHAATRAIT